MPAFHGHLHLRARPGHAGATALGEQSFRAPYHVSKPYWEGRALVVQVVNPTAGILEGDVLESHVRVDPHASLLLTTPSASRVFQMRTGHARNSQHFVVGADAWLEVCPEPLVPHRGSRFTQHTTVDVHPSGAVVYGDFFMPGRIARGEVWSWDALTLGFVLRVGERLVLQERLSRSGEELRSLAKLARQEDGACFANLVFYSGVLGAVGPWREKVSQLHGDGLWVGVSPLRVAGAWSVKMVARDSIQLRAAYAEFRAALAPFIPALGVTLRKQ